MSRLHTKSRAGGAAHAGPLTAELIAALAPDRVRSDSAPRALSAHDASVFQGGLSGPICYPLDTAEVQSIMAISAPAEGKALHRSLTE